MILCSMLLVSAVGYASNGDPTTKSPVCIVDAGNAGMAQTILATANFDVVLIAFEQVDVQRDVFKECEKILINNYHQEFAELPVDVGKITNSIYYLARHNKHLYNISITPGYSKLFKSDLIRSNCSITC